VVGQINTKMVKNGDLRKPFGVPFPKE